MSPGSDDSLEIRTRDQAEAAGAQIVALTIQVNAVLAKQNAAEFAAQKHGTAAAGLKERIGRYEEALRVWAQAHRAEMGEKKSMELRHVSIAFKLARPAVKLLEKFDLKDVLLKLLKSPKLKEYVRVKHELNRQRILDDARPESGRLNPDELKKFGLEISQEEKFYVEPKLTTT